jgi:hypothetical protein
LLKGVDHKRQFRESASAWVTEFSQTQHECRKRAGSSEVKLLATTSASARAAGVAIVSLDFVPEPSAIAQLVAGLSALAALYRFSMREPKG